MKKTVVKGGLRLLHGDIVRFSYKDRETVAVVCDDGMVRWAEQRGPSEDQVFRCEADVRKCKVIDVLTNVSSRE